MTNWINLLSFDPSGIISNYIYNIRWKGGLTAGEELDKIEAFRKYLFAFSRLSYTKISLFNSGCHDKFNVEGSYEFDEYEGVIVAREGDNIIIKAVKESGSIGGRVAVIIEATPYSDVPFELYFSNNGTTWYPSPSLTRIENTMFYVTEDGVGAPKAYLGGTELWLKFTFDRETVLKTFCVMFGFEEDLKILNPFVLDEVSYFSFRKSSLDGILSYDIKDFAPYIHDNTNHDPDMALFDLSNVEDATILNKLKNVDGIGSGLDADLLDGHHASYFATSTHLHDSRYLRRDTNTTPTQDNQFDLGSSTRRFKTVYASTFNGKATDSDKLDGHDSSYFANNTLSNVSNSTILNKIKQVDGSGSGLDADLLDGHHASYFALANHNHDDRYYTKSQLQTSGQAQVHWGNITNKPSVYTPATHGNERHDPDMAYIDLSNVSNSTILNKIKQVDGSGSGLDADLLDGYHASYFATSTHLHDSRYLRRDTSTTPTQDNQFDLGSSTRRFKTVYASTFSGTATNADKLDGHDSSYFANNTLSNVSNNTILDKIKQVDGSGSGLDADLLDGHHASDFALASHNHDDRYYTKSQLQTSGQAQVHWGNITNKPSVYTPATHGNERHDPDMATYNLGNVADSVILNKLKNVDGSGSGLDADLLDGYHASKTPTGSQIPVLDNGVLKLPFSSVPIRVSGQPLSERVFYVDGIIGDDSNDGSQTRPFATLNKAIESVPSGGFGRIYVAPTADGYVPIDRTGYGTINGYMEIISKVIRIAALIDHGNISPPDEDFYGINPNLIWYGCIDVYGSGFQGFRLSNSLMYFYSVNFVLASYVYSSVKPPYGVFDCKDSLVILDSCLVKFELSNSAPIVPFMTSKHGFSSFSFISSRMKVVGSCPNSWLCYCHLGSNIAYFESDSVNEVNRKISNIIYDSSGRPCNVLSNVTDVF